MSSGLADILEIHNAHYETALSRYVSPSLGANLLFYTWAREQESILKENVQEVSDEYATNDYKVYKLED